MKKISLLLGLLFIALTPTSVAARGNSFSRHVEEKAAKQNKSVSQYESVRKLYESGKISADSVVGLALYHKVWSPAVAERCLKLVADKNPRALMELGVLYAFSPEYAKSASDGVKLLQAAADAGYNESNAYLGLYYFTHGDYTKAKKYLDACRPMKFGFGDTALGSMYLAGYGVREDVPKAREYFHEAALKGYPRGMTLYGFNLRANAGGPIDYPDSFFWLY
ncbi:MAG: hypothetical protein K2J10_05400, partial [Muribaculaceae bacterium]|nr:hypothetical protein [Muribaculaceae bacterium]